MLNHLIVEFDKVLKTLFHKPMSNRKHPDTETPDGEFEDNERNHIIGLMRVNHCGEICAQALYQGQALTARDKSNKEALNNAANEEIEHLAWTEHRIDELGGKTSIFNPIFYTGSLVIGITAGIIGDKWSLGFLEETEKQVEYHLTDHLEKLPKHDNKSRIILEQMREDEIKHGKMASSFGAQNLPLITKKIMQATSKLMTTVTYRI